MTTTFSRALSLAALSVALTVVAAAPAHAETAQGDGHRLFDKIDTNHDGVISLAEWEAAKAAFKAKHPNAKLPEANGKGDGHPLFDKIDTNHDGVISLAEWEAFRAAHPGKHHRQTGAGSGATGTAPAGNPQVQ